MPRGVYDEKAKARTAKYLKEKRETFGINLPKGDKGRYKRYAAFRGKSLTALFVDLIENEIKEDGWKDENAQP